MSQQPDLRQIIREEYLKCAQDPAHFMKKYCHIQHPQRGRVLFNLYPFEQKTLRLLDYTNLGDFKKDVDKYKQFLIEMNKDAGLNITNNSDLLNIRDEILGNLNQFTYLLTFK